MHENGIADNGDGLPANAPLVVGEALGSPSEIATALGVPRTTRRPRSAPRPAAVEAEEAPAPPEQPPLAPAERTFRRMERPAPAPAPPPPIAANTPDSETTRADSEAQRLEGDRWGRRDRRDRPPRGERRFERADRVDRPDREQQRFDRDDRPERPNAEQRVDRSNAAPLNITELEALPRENLIDLATEMGLPDAAAMRKQDLIIRLLQVQAESRGNIFAGGFLEVSDDGNYGFLRGERMLPGPHDIYVSQSQLRRFALRAGDYVTGQVRQPRDNEKYYGLLKVEAVNGMDPEVAKRRPFFENLTAIFPKEQMKLETTPDNLTHRIIDLIAPVGRGQRGLIVSPPKAGKTMLLKNIANGITTNYPDVHLIVLLIGERPEEVTDMQRTVRGEVVSSTFDEPVEDHTRVAEMALERAKRLVECGKDVVILMDSITRLTRAYNLALPPSGRTLSGGVDPVALYPPKRLFGAARKCEEGGSLTILATCLVDTGSRMDEVVFEEFKGTGNLELRLDRKLAERRFYPAIDIQASGTRREELLLDEKTLRGVYLVRRMTAMISQNAPNQLEATERLLERLARTSTNEEFLTSLKTDL